jgi:hypothetical protein
MKATAGGYKDFGLAISAAKVDYTLLSQLERTSGDGQAYGALTDGETGTMAGAANSASAPMMGAGTAQVAADVVYCNFCWGAGHMKWQCPLALSKGGAKAQGKGQKAQQRPAAVPPANLAVIPPQGQLATNVANAFGAGKKGGKPTGAQSGGKGNFGKGSNKSKGKF